MKKFKSLREAYEYYRENPDGLLPMSEVARATEFSIFLQRGLNKLLLKGYKEYAGVYKQIMTIVPSDGAIETYPNLGTVTAPEERLPNGEFVRGSFTSENVKIVNKEYGEIIEIDRGLIQTDQTKAIKSMPTKLGQAHARKKDMLTADFYNDGTSTTIYDGVYMFAASGSEHPNVTGGTANSDNVNYGALGTLSETNLEAALAQIALWRGLEGELLDDDPNMKLVVSSSQSFTAQRLIKSSFEVADNRGHVTNIHKGTFKDLVTFKRLTADDWYILLPAYPGNVLQEFIPLELAKEADDAGESFDKRIYRYRSYEAYRIGCADWRFGYKGN